MRFTRSSTSDIGLTTFSTASRRVPADHQSISATTPDIARDTSRTAGDHEARLLRLEALVGQAPR